MLSKLWNESMSQIDSTIIEKMLREIQVGQSELPKQVVALAHGQIALLNDLNALRGDVTDLRKEMHDHST